MVRLFIINYYCIGVLFQNPDETKIHTGPEETLLSHLLVFAAERARKENRVVSLKEDGQYD